LPGKIEISFTQIHDPQISNQIAAAGFRESKSYFCSEILRNSWKPLKAFNCYHGSQLIDASAHGASENVVSDKWHVFGIQSNYGYGTGWQM